MQFFSTVYSAVKRSCPLVQNFRVGVPNGIPTCILNQSVRAFSSRLDSNQEAILSSIPHKPKKPPSVYIRYVKMVEPKLIQQFPNAKRTEIIKTAAKMYKTADKETLLDLLNSYSKDVEQYKKDLAVYESKLTEEQKEALTKLKSIEKKVKIRRQLKQDKKAANKPKQPLNAYMLFVNKKRAEQTPTDTLVEWTKKIGDQWKNLPQDEKNKFIAEANELRQKYKDDISKWEASIENTEYSHLLKHSEKSESKTKSTKSKSLSQTSKEFENKTKNAKSKSKESENRLEPNSVSTETAYTPHRKDSVSSIEDSKFQSSPSCLKDKIPKIYPELKKTTSYYLVDDKVISKLKEKKLYKTVFLNNVFFTVDKTVGIVIGVTFVSFFIVLPLVYIFCC